MCVWLVSHLYALKIHAESEASVNMWVEWDQAEPMKLRVCNHPFHGHCFFFFFFGYDWIQWYIQTTTDNLALFVKL